MPGLDDQIGVDNNNQPVGDGLDIFRGLPNSKGPFSGAPTLFEQITGLTDKVQEEKIEEVPLDVKQEIDRIGKGYGGNGWQDLVSEFKRGQKSFDIERDVGLILANPLADQSKIKTLKAAKDYLDKMSVEEDKMNAPAVLASIAQVLGGMWEAIRSSWGETIAGAGIGKSIGGGAGALAGASRGLGVGSLRNWAQQGAGSTYFQLTDAGIDEKTARMVSIPAGIVYGSIENIFKLLKFQPAIIKPFKNFLQREVTKSAIKIAARYAAGIAGEALVEEPLQQLTQDAAQNLAVEITDDVINKSTGTPIEKFTKDELFQRMLKSAIAAVGPAAILGGIGGGLDVGSAKNFAAQAKSMEKRAGVDEEEAKEIWTEAGKTATGDVTQGEQYLKTLRDIVKTNADTETARLEQEKTVKLEEAKKRQEQVKSVEDGIREEIKANPEANIEELATKLAEARGESVEDVFLGGVSKGALAEEVGLDEKDVELSEQELGKKKAQAYITRRDAAIQSLKDKGIQPSKKQLRELDKSIREEVKPPVSVAGRSAFNEAIAPKKKTVEEVVSGIEQKATEKPKAAKVKQEKTVAEQTATGEFKPIRATLDTGESVDVAVDKPVTIVNEKGDQARQLYIVNGKLKAQKGRIVNGQFLKDSSEPYFPNAKQLGKGFRPLRTEDVVESAKVVKVGEQMVYANQVVTIKNDSVQLVTMPDGKVKRVYLAENSEGKQVFVPEPDVRNRDIGRAESKKQGTGADISLNKELEKEGGGEVGDIVSAKGEQGKKSAQTESLIDAMDEADNALIEVDNLREAIEEKRDNGEDVTEDEKRLSELTAKAKEKLEIVKAINQKVEIQKQTKEPPKPIAVNQKIAAKEQKPVESGIEVGGKITNTATGVVWDVVDKAGTKLGTWNIKIRDPKTGKEAILPESRILENKKVWTVGEVSVQPKKEVAQQDKPQSFTEIEEPKEDTVEAWEAYRNKVAERLKQHGLSDEEVENLNASLALGERRVKLLAQRRASASAGVGGDINDIKPETREMRRTQTPSRFASAQGRVIAAINRMARQVGGQVSGSFDDGGTITVRLESGKTIEFSRGTENDQNAGENVRVRDSNGNIVGWKIRLADDATPVTVFHEGSRGHVAWDMMSDQERASAIGWMKRNGHYDKYLNEGKRNGWIVDGSSQSFIDDEIAARFISENVGLINTISRQNTPIGKILQKIKEILEAITVGRAFAGARKAGEAAQGVESVSRIVSGEAVRKGRLNAGEGGVRAVTHDQVFSVYANSEFRNRSNAILHRMAGTLEKELNSPLDNYVESGLRKLRTLGREGVNLANEIEAQKPRAFFRGSQGRSNKGLQEAKKMAAEKKPREEIFAKTGWWKDSVDGQWKIEIDPKDSKLKPRWNDVLRQGRAVMESLGNLLDSPELFAQYPYMKNMTVELRDDMGEEVSGSFRPGALGNHVIALNRRNMLKKDDVGRLSSLMHEAQHALQVINGFSEGTSIDAATLYAASKFAKQYEKQFGFPPPVPMAPKSEIRKAYDTKGGEVESRLVQYRMEKMTKEERMAEPPWISRQKMLRSEKYAESDLRASTRSSDQAEKDLKYKDLERLSMAGDKQAEAEAQRMVDEAAKEAGYTTRATHRTSEDFTTFLRGYENSKSRAIWRDRTGMDDLYPGAIYFYPETAGGVTRSENFYGGSKLLRVYLRMSNPYRAGDFGSEVSYLSEERINQLKLEGFDSAITPESAVMDAGQLAVFDPSQIKSADPFTYDDSGKLIPLSRRFDSKSEDIRFSKRSSDRSAAMPKTLSEYKRSLLESKGVDWRNSSEWKSFIKGVAKSGKSAEAYYSDYAKKIDFEAGLNIVPEQDVERQIKAVERDNPDDVISDVTASSWLGKMTNEFRHTVKNFARGMVQNLPTAAKMVSDDFGKEVEERLAQSGNAYAKIINKAHEILRDSKFEELNKEFSPDSAVEVRLPGQTRLVKITKGMLLSYVRLAQNEKGREALMSGGYFGVEKNGPRFAKAQYNSKEEKDIVSQELLAWSNNMLAQDESLRRMNDLMTKIMDDNVFPELARVYKSITGKELKKESSYLAINRLGELNTEAEQRNAFAKLLTDWKALESRQTSDREIVITDATRSMYNSLDKAARFIGYSENLRYLRGLLGSSLEDDSGEVSGSFADMIDQKLGAGTAKYVLKQIQSAEGVVDPQDFTAIRRLMQRQDLARLIGPSTAIKQLGAIFMPMLNTPIDVVTKGMASPVDENIFNKVMESDAGQMVKLRLAQGTAIDEFAEARHRRSELERKVEKYGFMPMRAIDTMTVKWYYKIAKAYVDSIMPNLSKDSKEYYNEIARRTTKMMNEFQPSGYREYRTAVHNAGLLGAMLNRYRTSVNAINSTIYRRYLDVKRDPSADNKAAMYSALAVPILAQAMFFGVVDAGLEKWQEALVDAYGDDDEKKKLAKERKITRNEFGSPKPEYLMNRTITNFLQQAPLGSQTAYALQPVIEYLTTRRKEKMSERSNMNISFDPGVDFFNGLRGIGAAMIDMAESEQQNTQKKRDEAFAKASRKAIDSAIRVSQYMPVGNILPQLNRWLGISRIVESSMR